MWDASYVHRGPGSVSQVLTDLSWVPREGKDRHAALAIGVAEVGGMVQATSPRIILIPG
jgi:hypothetical protein